MRSWLFVTTLCLAAAVPGRSARAGAASQAAGQLILREGSSWRACYVWKTPVIRKGTALETAGGAGGSYLSSWQAKGPPPPAGWTEPDFDDAAWGRVRVSRHNRHVYGFAGSGPALGAQHLRGRFKVTDPGGAQLTLSLGYRGGAVVYVNGKEIARGHLPKGKLNDATLAEDYPKEAFLDAKGQCIRTSSVHYQGSVKRNAAGLAKRIRKIESLSIDPKLLRAGVNILAVEVHRAPYFGIGLRKEGANHRSAWGTCGLVSLELRGAGALPNVSRPRGVQVWNASTLTRVYPGSYADPLEPLRPISIVAARNGRFTGKVVVSSDGALRGVAATASDLKHKDGKGSIPASAIKIFYSGLRTGAGTRYRGTWFGPLSEKSPAQAPSSKSAGIRRGGPESAQPIFIKVRVPADAKPGVYEGKLSVSGPKPTQVPIRLQVVDWKLPDPKDYVTHMGIIQSPETVAMKYKVPLWSEKHWKLIEKSFQHLGEIGNKVVVLPLICQTNFGNSESMVRWVKNGQSGYRHDFAVFDRYLDLATKYTKPDVVWLYVWDRYAGQSRWAGKGDTEGRGVLVTLFDPKTGKSQELEGPRMGTPEGKAFLAPVYKEVRARLAKRGLLKVTMMGTNGDAYWPTKSIAEMLKEAMPGTKWINSSHPDTRGRNMRGIPIGYNTCVYINLFPPPGGVSGKRSKDGYYYGWRSKAKSDIFPRSGGPATRQPLYHSQALSVQRITMEAAFQANCSGLGRTGADFWPVLQPPKRRRTGKRSESIVGRYVETCWNQLNMNTATEFLLAPGPDGAISTERFEMVREGVQECEARIFIEKALLAKKLDAATAQKCRALLDERAFLIRSGCLGSTWNWYEEQAPTVLAEKLFTCAAEVAGKLGVR